MDYLPCTSRSIIGVRVDSTSYHDACKRIQAWAEARNSCYIVAANVHVVMTAYWQGQYQKIINQAVLVTPDGMPLVWALRLLGVRGQTRVYGPDLMLAWCDRAARLKIPIYLYGGTEPMLDKLQYKLTQQFPSLAIAGSYAPPFRVLTPEEEKSDVQRINDSGAAVVFVGLGCPKQEEWMARQQGKVAAVMIGVGAAFSFHSGEVAQAPRWMMNVGLEWLYRFSQEPKRLWQRYCINNPSFVILFSLQLVQRCLRLK
ncbi:WecB/TagA/CpsF family glycosyltransferase [Trichocoleus desertorum AS-A10]|uniref:WecB/TagA/CpsF family glycosyltransferase n=1 Tax=Trichocoleus desertorum TaxID=1481672 RepID=UPI0032A02920